MMRPFADYPVTCAMSFIEEQEGFRALPYRCPAGVPTIGFGHTGDLDALTPPLTYHEGEELLRGDLERFKAELAPAVRVPVSEEQFIALLSLAYNIGVPTLVKRCPKLMAALNRGDYETAATEFLDITSGDIPGLVKRRAREAALMRVYS